MKAASLKELKLGLKEKSEAELIDIVLHLSKHKKENKELLTYILFEKDYEQGYIDAIKVEMDTQFDEMNTYSYYYMKKSCRKILRMVKKFIRYSKLKETEAELLIYFCEKLLELSPSIRYNVVLTNMLNMQKKIASKAVSTLHEDLQYDFNKALENL
jgi:hypothetical protein